MKLSDPISKKSKKGQSKSLLSNTEPSNSKLCQLCVKYLPNVKNTHNTAQCRKWNADSSKKKRACSSHIKNINAHASNGGNDIMEWFAQIRKEVKTLRKLINKSRTSHSKRGIMNPLTTGGSVCAKVFDTPQPCYLKVML